MKVHRTVNRPLFEGILNNHRAWSWVVTMQVGRSGYVTCIHVSAARGEGDERIVGAAYGDVPPFVDVNEAIEVLATEAMMEATHGRLIPLSEGRKVDVSAAIS